MNYKKAKPTGGAIQHKDNPFEYKAAVTPEAKWKHLTKDDVEEIIALTSVGREAFKKSMEDMEAKMKEDVREQCIKQYAEKLYTAEDYIAAQGILGAANSIEETFRKAAIDPERKGFKKNRLTLKEVQQGMIDNWPYGLGQVTKETLKSEWIRVQETYDVEFGFKSYNLNSEFNLDEYDFVEDDTPFEYLTAWQIYEEGLRIGDHSTRILSSISLYMAMKETMMPILDTVIEACFPDMSDRLKQRAKKAFNKATDLRGRLNVDTIKRANELIDKFCKINPNPRVKNPVKEAVDNLFKYWPECPREWTHDLMMFFKFQNLTHGAYERHLENPDMRKTTYKEQVK